MISLILLKGVSNRQANDFKRALRGKQPTSFIVFILFVLCYFNLFCRYLSKYDTKKRNYFEAIDQKQWGDRACGGTVVPDPQSTKTKKKGRSRRTARACRNTAVCNTLLPITQNFFLLLPHSNTTTSFIFQTSL